VLLSVFEWRSQPWWLVAYVDAFLTVFFVADFILRLSTAPSKKRYLGRGGGVLDLLSCTPGLRIFRVFRIVRAVRIIRRLVGRRVFGELRGGLAAGTVYLVILIGFVTLEVVGLLELHFERARRARTSRLPATRSGGATSPLRRWATATITR
jgi:voltage-gated potassium channel